MKVVGGSAAGYWHRSPWSPSIECHKIRDMNILSYRQHQRQLCFEQTFILPLCVWNLQFRWRHSETTIILKSYNVPLQCRVRPSPNEFGAENLGNRWGMGASSRRNVRREEMYKEAVSEQERGGLMLHWRNYVLCFIRQWHRCVFLNSLSPSIALSRTIVPRSLL